MTSLSARVLVWGPSLFVVLVGCGGHTDPVFGADSPDATAAGVDGGGIAPGADGSVAADGSGGTGKDGAAGGDSGGSSTDAGSGYDAAACFEGDGGVLATSKGCVSPQNCAVTVHGGCCGPQYADGINHAFVKVYNTCENGLSNACGARGCASGPLFAEDGNMGTFPGTIQVTCDMGVCRTFVN